MRWFWLYRPTVPTMRAQAIQVVNMAHAMASRGHQVQLCVEVEGRADAARILDFYGLAPVDGLNLQLLPASRTLASIAFRAALAHWALTGGQVLYARSKRYAIEASRFFPGTWKLVLEVHEIDKAIDRDVLERAAGVVANAPGTLEVLRESGVVPKAIVAQNGTQSARVRHPEGPGEGVGYAGSLRDYKDLDTLFQAAAKLPWPVHVVGARTDEILAKRMDNVVFEPILPYRDVPDRLARFRVLVLPLSRGTYGEKLASPLKLWDYLASGVPIVGADLPALHAAAPGAFEPYQPGDPASLAAAIQRVATDEDLRRKLLSAARVRTWDERAAEIEAFVAGLG